MAGIDKFGIRKIYPTKPGGEQWYFNIDDPNNDQEQEKEGDHRLLSCRKMMMAAGKYKALK
jgi:hypothetical protein